MEGCPDTVQRVDDRLAALDAGPLLLAVSGGADSMVLLHAAATVLPPASVTVATFDHGTGHAASAAAAFVARSAASLGLRCIQGSAGDAGPGRSEAEWRRARWSFLLNTAVATGSRVATGHTRDDQVETVFMRILRGAGPRGLAGLYADSPTLRPLLDTTRVEILQYARTRAITFVTDPSNVDRRHLRNRVRLDLLPAIERIQPGFSRELLKIACSAAHWRARMEGVALTFPMMTDSSGLHSFARAPLRGYPIDSLHVLWPSLAARAGVVMDRRGTARLSAFTIEGETGQAIQLAGSVEVRMARHAVVFRTGVGTGLRTGLHTGASHG